jgi:hypothetical protein
MNFCPHSRHLLFEFGETWFGISAHGDVERFSSFMKIGAGNAVRVL